MRVQGQRVLVTGASDGIGRELVGVLADQGYDVLASGRRPAAQATAGLPAGVRYVAADLGTPAGVRELVGATTAWAPQGLAAFVHVAGVGRYGDVAAESALELDRILDVNLGAAVELCHGLYPCLARAGGQVLLVGSVAAFFPAASYASYAASKAALEGFARNVRQEWRGRVGVGIAHPGAVRTQMHEKAGVPVERLAGARLATAGATARQLAAALKGRARSRVLGIVPRLLVALGRTAPSLTEWAMRRGARS